MNNVNMLYCNAFLIWLVCVFICCCYSLGINSLQNMMSLLFRITFWFVFWILSRLVFRNMLVIIDWHLVRSAHLFSAAVPLMMQQSFCSQPASNSLWWICTALRLYSLNTPWCDFPWIKWSNLILPRFQMMWHDMQTACTGERVVLSARLKNQFECSSLAVVNHTGSRKHHYQVNVCCTV